MASASQQCALCNSHHEYRELTPATCCTAQIQCKSATMSMPCQSTWMHRLRSCCSGALVTKPPLLHVVFVSGTLETASCGAASHTSGTLLTSMATACRLSARRSCVLRNALLRLHGRRVHRRRRRCLSDTLCAYIGHLLRSCGARTLAAHSLA